MDKYKETGTIMAVKARNELAMVSMEKKEYPDHLFDTLLNNGRYPSKNMMYKKYRKVA